MEGFSNLSARTNLKLSISRQTFKEENKKTRADFSKNNVGFLIYCKTKTPPNTPCLSKGFDRKKEGCMIIL